MEIQHFLSHPREKLVVFPQNKKSTEWNSRNLFHHQFNRTTMGSIDRKKMQLITDRTMQCMCRSMTQQLTKIFLLIFLFFSHPQLAARAFMQIFSLLIHLRPFSRVWLLMKL